MTLVINIVFISAYSYKASAVATLVAYSIMVLLSYYFGRKYYPIPYNLKKIGLYLMLSVAMSVLSFYYFRGNYILGISMLIVFLGIVFFSEKNEIKQLLKR
jgi:O-antigen/teichoic acid export membrane protein